MDTPQASTSVQISPQPAVVSPAKPPNRRWVLWSAIGLTFLIFGIALGIFSAKFLNQSSTQPQLASTLTAAPSAQSPTLTLAPIVSPEPAAETDDPTADWKTYKSSFWNIELKYPLEVRLANKMVFEQEVLRFENENGYMQIENACTLGTQGNQEDNVSLLGSVFPRYRLPKSGEFNQLYLNINPLKVTDQRCIYVIFGLKPEFEKTEKLLFDQILSTFKFTN